MENYEEIILDTKQSQPLIVGKSNQLINKLEEIENKYPLIGKLLLDIVKEYSDKHPLLEDWLIIPFYQFVWDQNHKALRWFEDILIKIENLYPKELGKLRIEIIQQTKTNSTHEMLNVMYNYFLQIYATIWLIEEGFHSIIFPPSNSKEKNKGKSVDIIAYKNDNQIDIPYAIECKFIKISTKFESALRRYYNAYRKYFSKFPILFPETFTFPSAKNVQALGPKHINAIKNFLQMIYKNIESNPIAKEKCYKGIFSDQKNKSFEIIYKPYLPIAKCIELQTKDAYKNASNFFNNIESRIIENAITQLNDPKYDKHKKIIYLGLQPDKDYAIYWTKGALYEEIEQLQVKMKNKEIQLEVKICEYI